MKNDSLALSTIGIVLFGAYTTPVMADVDVLFSKYLESGSGGPKEVCLGNGDGTFTSSNILVEDPSFRNRDVELTHVDGDSVLGAIFSGIFAAGTRVCIGDRTGSFTARFDVDDTASNRSIADIAIGESNAGGHQVPSLPTKTQETSRVCLNTTSIPGSPSLTCSNVDTAAVLDERVTVAVDDLHGDMSLDAVLGAETCPHII